MSSTSSAAAEPSPRATGSSSQLLPALLLFLTLARHPLLLLSLQVANAWPPAIRPHRQTQTQMQMQMQTQMQTQMPMQTPMQMPMQWQWQWQWQIQTP